MRTIKKIPPPRPTPFPFSLVCFCDAFSWTILPSHLIINFIRGKILMRRTQSWAPWTQDIRLIFFGERDNTNENLIISIFKKKKRNMPRNDNEMIWSTWFAYSPPPTCFLPALLHRIHYPSSSACSLEPYSISPRLLRRWNFQHCHCVQTKKAEGECSLWFD